jgi:predicted metal-dependent hydrolase
VVYTIDGFEFKIEKSKRYSKKVSLRIDKDGRVVLTFPWKISEREALKLVRDNLQKIKASVQNFSEQFVYNGGDTLLYLGVPRKIVFDSSVLVPFSYNMDKFVLNPRYADNVYVLARRWLVKKAEEYLPKRLMELAQKLGVRYKKVQVRDVRSRWGSCSSKGTISLNWRLIMAPIDVIDYVLIHELAHIVHPNHSKYFWEYVATFCPDYKLHKSWLRKNGHYLFNWSVKLADVKDS